MRPTIRVEENDRGWRLSGPTHRALWTSLAEGSGVLTTPLLSLDTTGCFFECAPVCAINADAPWQCQVLPTTGFDTRTADSRPFAAHLEGPGPDVRVFDNLRGDSTLIAPTAEGSSPSGYPHLLCFLRTAPTAQSNRLWAATAREVLARLDDPAPLWVSTHGFGVFWLHIRLDRRPKYYHYARFKVPPV